MGFTIRGGGGSGTGTGGTTDHNALVNKNLPNQHTINAIQGLQSELYKKVSVIIGKGLSSNDYDNTAKNKVDNLNITQVVDLDAVKNASHTHANTSVLGKIGEDSNGKATYNNEIIFKNDANQINNTPAGNITASNVQAAINELDNKKAPAGYGLGSTSTVLSSINLNTVQDIGFYFVNSTCTNQPIAGVGFHLLVYGGVSTQQFSQIATQYNTVVTYTRACVSGTWSAWKQIATTSSPTLTGTVTLSGGQLKFPATQNASTDPNTLDDYEEGTWTPALYGSTTAGSYTLSSINTQYTKIGNIVHVFGFFSIAIASAGAGGITIGGLPFAKFGNSNAVGSILITGCSLTEGFSVAFTHDSTAVNTIGVYKDAGISPVLITSISAGSIYFSITYRV